MMRPQLPGVAGERDRGSVSVFFALATFAMIMMVGLTVDLAGQVHAQQHARDVAAQAARGAGQRLQAPAAVTGHAGRVDPGAAAAAARTYLAAADVEGSVSTQGGDTIVVDTTDTYSTKFLSVIGISQLHVSGHAESQVVRAVGGTQR